MVNINYKKHLPALHLAGWATLLPLVLNSAVFKNLYASNIFFVVFAYLALWIITFLVFKLYISAHLSLRRMRLVKLTILLFLEVALSWSIFKVNHNSLLGEHYNDQVLSYRNQKSEILKSVCTPDQLRVALSQSLAFEPNEIRGSEPIPEIDNSAIDLVCGKDEINQLLASFKNKRLEIAKQKTDKALTAEFLKQYGAHLLIGLVVIGLLNHVFTGFLQQQRLRFLSEIQVWCRGRVIDLVLKPSQEVALGRDERGLLQIVKSWLKVNSREARINNLFKKNVFILLDRERDDDLIADVYSTTSMIGSIKMASHKDAVQLLRLGIITEEQLKKHVIFKVSASNFRELFLFDYRL